MQVLSGVRVLEFGPGIAIAYAGKMFGDFGADVIKIEPPRGDPARGEGPFSGGQPDPETSAPFLFFNRNKRGVTLDPATEAGRGLLARLARTADLIIAAYSLRQLADFGLDLPGLTAQQPALVLVSLTPFGEDGPYRDFQATELVIDAIAGPVSATGAPSRAPLSKPSHMVAAQVGNAMASAALAGLIASERSGEGQEIQVCAADVLVTSFDRRAVLLMVYQVTGETLDRPFGSDPAGPLPGGRWPCADGFVDIATLPRWVPRMLATLQDPAVDEYFAAHPDAWREPATATVWLPALRQWLASRTRFECFEQATLGHGWPVYPVSRPRDLLTNPHFTERGYFIDLDHRSAGAHSQPGAPWRMADGGFEARRAAPLLGEHNHEIYAGELGLSAAQLNRARALGVI